MISLRFQNFFFGLAAIAWGCVPIYLHLEDRLKAYLAPEFRTYALLGGLGMIVLGLFIILTHKTPEAHSCCGHEHEHDEDCQHDHEHEHSHDDEAAACCGHDHDHKHDHDHAHEESHEHSHSDHHPFFALAVLILPLCLSFNFTQDEMTDKEINNAQAGLQADQSAQQIFSSLPPFTRETLERSTPKTPDGHFLIDLIQLYYASGDPEVQAVFKDLPVETTGQILPEHQRNPNGSRLRLFQVVMTCCAADSAVVPVALEFGKTPPQFENRDWVKVKGTMSYEKEGNVVYPVIKVTEITPTEKPYEDLFLRGY